MTGWRGLTDAVHEEGGRVFVQLRRRPPTRSRRGNRRRRLRTKPMP
nr:hypothetical protein [Streptomyces roseochromogenus]